MNLKITSLLLNVSDSIKSNSFVKAKTTQLKMFKFLFVLIAALFAVSMASPYPAPAPAPRPVARPEPAPQYYTPYAYTGGYYASPYAYYG
ncbi:hypothetical protein FF38_05817 [Lucilia cuprina]|uniref:Neuropeptide-like 4 n=2 Tax=Lucilia cuprina TaxID=7375 RepID=A0A0L0CMR6_LUCCU|nr:hypothetical protein FF38_05817 [Lucilia cuprina]